MMEQKIIRNKQELNDWLDYERKRYGIDKGVSEYLKYLFGTEKYVIWKFQQRLRITEYYYNSGKKIRYLFSMAKLNRLRNKYSLNIGLNICGRGLKVMHLGPILTNEKVIIGDNASIHINTAFVAGGRTSESPVLGNDIVVGVGATILGGIYIADGIAIGANALVNKSFTEKGIAIAGVPANKISDNGKKAWN